MIERREANWWTYETITIEATIRHLISDDKELLRRIHG